MSTKEKSDANWWEKALGKHPEKSRLDESYQERLHVWEEAKSEAQKNDKPFDQPKPMTLEHLKHEISNRKKNKYSVMFDNDGTIKEGYNLDRQSEMDARSLNEYYQKTARDLEQLLERLNQKDSRVKYPGEKEKLINFWDNPKKQQRLKEANKKEGLVDDYNVSGIVRDIHEELGLNMTEANARDIFDTYCDL